MLRNTSLGPKTSLAPARISSRVTINVGGVRFETHRSTLRAIPDTRLAWLTKSTGNNPDYDEATGEYFFDRHPGVFNMILNYYRTGKLHAPTDVCGPFFEEELAFWGIDEKQIEACCWSNYRAHRDAQETLAEFDNDNEDTIEDENDSIDDDEIARRFGIVNEGSKAEKSCYERCRPKVWALLDDPSSSSAAKVLTAVTSAFVIVSIGAFCLETHTNFRYAKCNVSLTADATVKETQRMTQPYLFLRVLESTCMAYFTLDIVVRFCFCPNKKKHILNTLTLLDVMSVMPFYIREIVKAIDPDLEDTDGIYFLNALRLILVFRILKLTRHFSGVKILGHTLKASAKELLLMILVLTIGVLTFACLIYYAEQIQEADVNDFKNIPRGYWWAVVTMTTLGYGDMFPRTVMGYIVGAICALCGLLMLALPVPVIVNNFTLYYSHAQAKLKLPKKTRNTLVGAPEALKASRSDTDSSPPSINASQSSILSDSEAVPSRLEMELKTMTLPGNEEAHSVESGYTAGSSERESSTTGVRVLFTDEVSLSSRSPTGRSSSSRNIKTKLDVNSQAGGDEPSIITIVINGSQNHHDNAEGNNLSVQDNQKSLDCFIAGLQSVDSKKYQHQSVERNRNRITNVDI